MEKAHGVLMVNLLEMYNIWVDNSSSHTDKLLLKIIKNLKNYFLILGEGDTFGINGSFSVREKKLTLILLRQRQSFVWVCNIIAIIVIYC